MVVIFVLINPAPAPARGCQEEKKLWVLILKPWSINNQLLRWFNTIFGTLKGCLSFLVGHSTLGVIFLSSTEMPHWGTGSSGPIGRVGVLPGKARVWLQGLEPVRRSDAAALLESRKGRHASFIPEVTSLNPNPNSQLWERWDLSQVGQYPGISVPHGTESQGFPSLDLGPRPWDRDGVLVGQCFVHLVRLCFCCLVCLICPFSSLLSATSFSLWLPTLFYDAAFLCWSLSCFIL